MKVYACPKETPAPEVDYKNFSFDRMVADEKAHIQAVKAWLLRSGYDGKQTGQVLSFGVADGSAQYMFGDKGVKSILIHLPYGDAYQYPDVKFLPVAEVCRRLVQQAKFSAIFEKAKQ